MMLDDGVAATPPLMICRQVCYIIFAAAIRILMELPPSSEPCRHACRAHTPALPITSRHTLLLISSCRCAAPRVCAGAPRRYAAAAMRSAAHAPHKKILWRAHEAIFAAMPRMRLVMSLMPRASFACTFRHCYAHDAARARFASGADARVLPLLCYDARRRAPFAPEFSLVSPPCALPLPPPSPAAMMPCCAIA